MLSNFALPWSAEAIFSRVWACVLARSNQFLSIFPISISTPALAALLRLQPPSKKQIKRSIDDFIESLDREAICALASRQYGGLQCSIRRQSMGSFNICFIIDFIDGTTRLVRLPLEPAVRDVWNKVRSEVYTMQYLRDNTDIPIPRVYAYGRSRLRHGRSTLQVFLILEYIEGKPLDVKGLRKSPDQIRRRFLGDIVDMLAQLRGLEFSQGGSLIGRDEVTGLWSKIWRMLIPLREETYSLSSTQNRISKPHIIGAFSLRKNELQIDGYSAARVTANTAKEFLQEQYRIMRCMWSMPCQLLSQSVAERQLFAIHSLRPESAQHALGLRVDDDNVFCPIHPDFRAANIIVDEDMHLRGVIDWEFTQLVPRLAFVPPVWISGHDSQSLDKGVSLLPEFLNILSSKQHLS